MKPVDNYIGSRYNVNETIYREPIYRETKLCGTEIWWGGVKLQPSFYVPIIVLFIILFINRRNRKNVIAKSIIKKNKTEDRVKMVELAKRFIGKECIISAFDGSHQYEGVIKEVSGGAVLLEKDGQLQAINLDFVIRIREYPLNKKGKKKSVVLD